MTVLEPHNVKVPAGAWSAGPEVHALPAPSQALTGRTVLITGGSRGIGFGLAQGCVLAGAQVVLWGRDHEAGAAAADRLSEIGPAPTTFLRCDVADEQQVVNTFGQTVDRTGPVHAVFANAGKSSSFTPFHLQTNEEWQSVMGLNVDGLRWTLREVITHMLSHGQGGALVGVASMAARSGMRNYSPYATSKGAVVTLMKTLAVEYARKGIRSNSLLPGFVDTELTAGGTDEFYAGIVNRTPARRFGVQADFARLAAFLADPAQRFHTGDAVVVDGGYLNV